MIADPMRQIPIAALGQFNYCERRCFLMFVENIMEHNVHTVQGIVAHDNVDVSSEERRVKIKRLTALPLFSDELGLVGRADLVEIKDSEIIPVEFKKGRKSNWENNHIQLCAQALCLEEMLKSKIARGAIFNIQTKKRVQVDFTEPLIKKTKDTITLVRELFASNEAPGATLKPQCEGCSLFGTCLPEISDRSRRQYSLHRSRLFVIESVDE